MNARGGLDRGTYGGDAGAMAGHARHVAALGPASVAVHDDGDMFGEPCRIQMPVNFAFLAVEPRGYFAVQSGHDMRLPQGGWGCNERNGAPQVVLALVRDSANHCGGRKDSSAPANSFPSFRGTCSYPRFGPTAPRIDRSGVFIGDR